MAEKIRSGQEAKKIGSAAEIRLAQRIIYILNNAGVDWEMENTGLLDAEGIDLRVRFKLNPAIDSWKVIDFQVSLSHKSKKERKKLIRDHIIPIVVSSNESDEDLDKRLRSYFLPVATMVILPLRRTN